MFDLINNHNIGPHGGKKIFADSQISTKYFFFLIIVALDVPFLVPLHHSFHLCQGRNGNESRRNVAECRPTVVHCRNPINNVASTFSVPIAEALTLDDCKLALKLN